MVFLKRYASFFFWIIVLLHCMAIYFSVPTFRGITKLLLIPFLFTGWILPARQAGKKISLLVIMGLLFSLAGDYLLMLKGSATFLLGMLAFMFTHICNGSYFYLRMGKRIPHIKKLYPITGLLILIAGSIYVVLFPFLKSFAIPVLVYMILITTMTFLAAATGQVASLAKTANTWFIPGALLFVFSDGLLAMNMFMIQNHFLDIPVMISYAAAEYFLVNGFIRAADLSVSAAPN